MEFDYNFDYAYAMEDELGAAFGIFYLIYYLVAFGIGIAGYILSSLGLYTIAKRRGITNPWLSWIPVASAWIVGSISDQYRYVTKGQIKNKRKILLILEIAVAVLTIVMMVMMIVSIADLAMVSLSGSEADILSGVMSLMLGLLGMVLLLGGVGIACAVFRYMAMYDLYTSVNPPYNVVFLVLSIIFSVTEPFFIFFNRKKDAGMPPRCDVPVEPVQPQYLPPQMPIQEPWEHPEE